MWWWRDLAAESALRGRAEGDGEGRSSADIDANGCGSPPVTRASFEQGAPEASEPGTVICRSMVKWLLVSVRALTLVLNETPDRCSTVQQP